MRAGHEDVGEIGLPRLILGDGRLGQTADGEALPRQPSREGFPHAVDARRVLRGRINGDEAFQQGQHFAFLIVEKPVKRAFPLHQEHTKPPGKVGLPRRAGRKNVSGLSARRALPEATAPPREPGRSLRGYFMLLRTALR